MMDPFGLLGVDRDADERSIKRAYAQRLRQTRPEDDPEGFQRLNEAYQTALAQARRRRDNVAHATDVAPSATDPSENAAAQATYVAATVPAAPRTPPPMDLAEPRDIEFDLGAFVVDFRRHCVVGNPEALSTWLSQQPELWDLHAKQLVGEALLYALYDAPEDISEACFEATSRFFQYDDALGDVDAMLLRKVRTRATLAWSMHNGEHAELARRVLGDHTSKGPRAVRAAIKRASGSFRWWLDLPHTLRPNHYTRGIGATLAKLCNNDPENLPPPIVPDHARFWIDAASSGSRRTRLLIYAFRSVAFLLLIPTTVMVVLGAIATLNGVHDVMQTAWPMALAWLTLTGFVVAGFWLLLGGGWLIGQLDDKIDATRWFRLATALLTPALCVAALVAAITVDSMTGVALAAIGMFIAAWRYLSMHGTGKQQLHRKQGLRMIYIVAALGSSSLLKLQASAAGIWQTLPTIVIIAVTLGIWAVDWRKRGFLRPKAAPQPD